MTSAAHPYTYTAHSQQPQAYRSIIDKVINSVRPDFEENGIEEAVLQALQQVRDMIRICKVRGSTKCSLLSIYLHYATISIIDLPGTPRLVHSIIGSASIWAFLPVFHSLPKHSSLMTYIISATHHIPIPMLPTLMRHTIVMGSKASHVSRFGLQLRPAHGCLPEDASSPRPARSQA